MNKLLLLLIVTLICILKSVYSEINSFDIIQEKELSRYKDSGTIDCNTEKCCLMSDNIECSLSDMIVDESTYVFPSSSSDTTCIFNTPYAFQVIPGASDKLIVYYQGGGACWDAASTLIDPLCTTETTPQPLIGIFDRTNKNNLFRDYTIVMVMYCSGDIHGGDVIQSYSKNGKPVVQKGYQNAKSVLDWVIKQQNVGSLDKVLSSLVVMGCSAGSIGTQLWADTVLTSVKWNQAAIIPDSYAGVFPDGSEGPLIYNFGFCKTPLISSDLIEQCKSGKLQFTDIMQENISKMKDIPYTYIQSKIDEIQMSFYVSVGITTNTSASITPSAFYAMTNEIFGSYNNLHQNFVVFLVDGDHHCFTDQDIYYTADALGYKNDGAGDPGMMLYQWLNQMPLKSKSSISTSCSGDILKETILETSTKTFKNVEGQNTYCSASVFPKTFIEP